MMWSWSSKTGSDGSTTRTEEAGTKGADCALVHGVTQYLLHVDDVHTLHLP